MFGDTGAGTCLSFGTLGYLEGGLSHPTLTCSRLNVAENNRALVTDRAYFSYRHFENATPGKIFTLMQNLNVDRSWKESRIRPRVSTIFVWLGTNWSATSIANPRVRLTTAPLVAP